MINHATQEIIATAFAPGRVHDFRLYQDSGVTLAKPIRCLADAGYQGLAKLHPNSQTPVKRSKHHPLSGAQRRANRQLAQQRILCEQVIRKLKIFRIVSERYRNRRRRFGLRFNLIAAIYNLELQLPAAKSTFARGLMSCSTSSLWHS